MALADYLVSKGITSQTLECLKKEGFQGLDDLLMLLEEEGNPFEGRMPLQQYLRLRRSLQELQVLAQNASQSYRIFYNISGPPSGHISSPQLGRRTPPPPSLTPREHRLHRLNRRVRLHQQEGERILRLRNDSANESDSATENELILESGCIRREEPLPSYSSSPVVDQGMNVSSDDSPKYDSFKKKRVTFSEQINYSSDEEAFRHDPYNCVKLHASPVLKSIINIPPNHSSYNILDISTVKMTSSEFISSENRPREESTTESPSSSPYLFMRPGSTSFNADPSSTNHLHTINESENEVFSEDFSPKNEDMIMTVSSEASSSNEQETSPSPPAAADEQIEPVEIVAVDTPEAAEDCNFNDPLDLTPSPIQRNTATPPLLGEAPLACWDEEGVDVSKEYKCSADKVPPAPPPTVAHFGVIKRWINYTLTTFPFQRSGKPSPGRTTDI